MNELRLIRYILISTDFGLRFYFGSGSYDAQSCLFATTELANKPTFCIPLLATIENNYEMMPPRRAEYWE